MSVVGVTVVWALQIQPKDLSRLSLEKSCPALQGTDRLATVCREWKGSPPSLRCLFLLNRGRGFSDHI